MSQTSKVENEENKEEQETSGWENVKSNEKSRGKGIMSPRIHENIGCQNGFDALRSGDPGGSQEGTK